MEYEIDDLEGLFDASTNPSLAHFRPEFPRRSRLANRSRSKPCQKAVVIPEEEEQLA